jgi:hypothetical protein
MAIDDLLGSIWNVRGDIFRVVETDDGGLTSERLREGAWV